MLAWTEEDFRAHTQGTPLARLKLVRLKRNACVVLGNIGDADDLPSLESAANDADAVVAEHAQWAVERLRRRLATG
jgi:epoxyqueuosine reductase